MPENVRPGNQGHQTVHAVVLRRKQDLLKTVRSFLRQKEVVEEELEHLKRTLDMINYKCWYYEQAMKDGNEERLQKMIPDKLPEEIQKLYDHAHEK